MGRFRSPFTARLGGRNGGFGGSLAWVESMACAGVRFQAVGSTFSQVEEVLRNCRLKAT